MFYWHNSMASHVPRCTDLVLTTLSFILACSIKAENRGLYSELMIEINDYLPQLVLLFYTNFILTSFRYGEQGRLRRAMTGYYGRFPAAPVSAGIAGAGL